MSNTTNTSIKNMVSSLFKYLYLLVVFVFIGSILAQTTSAAQFSESYLRLDRMKANSNLSGTVCAKASSAGSGTENKILIHFPSDFTIDSDTSNWTTNTSDLPEGTSAWPGIGSTATLINNKTVIFSSSDITNNSTLYCFNFTGNSSTTGSTGNKNGSIETKSAGNSTIDISNYGLNILSSDQITITGKIAATASDFTNTLYQLTSAPNNETFNHDQEIEYQINYGTTLLYATSITLQASWSEGTIIENSTPSVDALRYVTGSAGKAYNATLPIINTVNRTITWDITSFPANTSNQTVNFKLKTTNDYTGQSRVRFTTSSKLFFADGETTKKDINGYYKYEEEKSTGSTTIVSPTIVPINKPEFKYIEINAINNSSASIITQTIPATTKIIKYGKSISNLDKSASGNLSMFNKISLTKLDPNTDYYFRIYATDLNNNQISSDIYTFKTAKSSTPLQANSISLVATSGNTIISSFLPEKNNILVIPVGSSFQFKFAMIKKDSANSVHALIKNDKVLGAFPNALNTEVSTDSVYLIEVEKGVYSGNLKTNNIPGIYGLFLKIKDNNGNIIEQELAKIKVINKFTVISNSNKNPIEGSRVLLYVNNPSSKEYQIIPSSSIELGNPLFTNNQGELNLALPQGKYKAEVSEILYKDKTVFFEIGLSDGKGFPVVELERTGISLIGLFNHYRRTISDVFIYNTKAYSETLTGSSRFFDLVSLISLAGVIILTIFAFSKRHRIPVSYIPSYFYYLIDRKSRNDKYIHGVVYDEFDKPIPSVNVYLTDKKDEKIIDNTKTNINGEFYFKKGKSEYLLMAMAKNYKTSPIFEYHEREHLKFKITLLKEEEGLNLARDLSHYFTHFVGMSFEVLLLGSFIFELLFLNSFGFTKTLPFLLISIFNLALWILHLHNKSHSKIVF